MNVQCPDCPQVFTGASAKKSLARHAKAKHAPKVIVLDMNPEHPPVGDGVAIGRDDDVPVCPVCGDPFTDAEHSFGVQTVDGFVHDGCVQDADPVDIDHDVPHQYVVNVDEDPEVPGRWFVSVGFDDLGFVEGETAEQATRRGMDHAEATREAAEDAPVPSGRLDVTGELVEALQGNTAPLEAIVESLTDPVDVERRDDALVMLTVEEHTALVKAAKDEWTERRVAVRTARETGQPEPPEGPNEQRLRRFIEGGRIIVKKDTNGQARKGGTARPDGGRGATVDEMLAWFKGHVADNPAVTAGGAVKAYRDAGKSMQSQRFKALVYDVVLPNGPTKTTKPTAAKPPKDTSTKAPRQAAKVLDPKKVAQAKATATKKNGGKPVGTPREVTPRMKGKRSTAA